MGGLREGAVEGLVEEVEKMDREVRDSAIGV
jgi:hypothetical protein